MDTIHLFELSGSLNAFPRGRDLDENTVFADPNGLVERDDVSCLCHDRIDWTVLTAMLTCTHLFLRRLWIERETGINLCGNPSRDDVQNFLPKFDQLTAFEKGVKRDIQNAEW